MSVSTVRVVDCPLRCELDERARPTINLGEIAAMAPADRRRWIEAHLIEGLAPMPCPHDCGRAFLFEVGDA